MRLLVWACGHVTKTNQVMFRSRGLDDDYHFNFWPRCHHLYDLDRTRRTAAGGVVDLCILASPIGRMR
ncbi:hypothetical protein AG1IA_00260 [Rhizoctonia solani AG-1 IA]|uniref:Uncharacterized protein n=1 Tax=Thanatephorus cucumeris (strain AG1-IA) TaxID=983506 RepID=L8X5Y6_THACA|nr:hypothetical protein AG1IA_00260 [Rhizoctonia solani AG-1 IA]